MARHRSGLKRLLDLKPKAHAGFSALTRGRPAIARALDFFPEFGPPRGMRVLHDDLLESPMAAPRYAAELARMREHNRESALTGPGIPPWPFLRRVVWDAPGIYIPGRIIMPVDRATGRIASFERSGPTNWSITRPRPFRRAPVAIPGRAVLIPLMKHYGHLLHDVLAPIAFAAHLGLITRDDPVTIVQARGDNPVADRFGAGMLRMGLARGITRLSREDSATCDAFLRCEALVGSGEHTYAMPEATPLLRAIFAAADPAPTTAPTTPPPARHARVYLTRGGAKLRQVEGEARLIELLRDRGFHIFESRWDNHAEQIEVFSGLDLLVGVHGAGLVNAVFGRPEATLVEICAVDARKTTGLHWAACAGMGYASVFGGPEGPRQSFAIDPDAVARAIDAWAR